MIYVKGSVCCLGSNCDIDLNYPIHTISLRDYYISETVVTNELWNLIMHFSKCRNNNNYPASGKLDEVLTFIGRLNILFGEKFRLPTMDEWEYAAKGGIHSKGYKYSGSDNIDDVAWYEGNSLDIKHPVGLKLPNELGLYDMSGNVFEYCSNNPSFDDTVEITRNTLGFLDLLIYRGGAFFAPKDVCENSFAFDWDQGGYSGFNGYGTRLCLSI